MTSESSSEYIKPVEVVMFFLGLILIGLALDALKTGEAAIASRIRPEAVPVVLSEDPVMYGGLVAVQFLLGLSFVVTVVRSICKRYRSGNGDGGDQDVEGDG